MSERTSYTPGTPCWVDLATPDLEAAAEFYGALFGWEIPELPNSAEMGGYRRAKKDGKDVAGVYAADAGGPAAGLGDLRLASTDADATAARGQRGRRHDDRRADGRRGPTARWRSSPTRPAPSSGSGSPAPSPAPSWSTSRLPSAGTSSTPATPPPPRSSTARVFGWALRGRKSPSGPGTYTVWTVGEAMVGGMLDMNALGIPAEVPPHWLVYFTVEDTDAAVEKVKSGRRRRHGSARSTSRSAASPSSPTRSAPSSR